MPQPEMDIEDDERSVKPLVLFGHHMVTDGTNPPPKDTKTLSFLEPRPAGTGLLGALKTEKFKDHQLWVFSGETRVSMSPLRWCTDVTWITKVASELGKDLICLR